MVKMPDRMNVVVVMFDTLRAADVGCYGSTVTRTPNIDALARRGVRFTRAYPESLPTIPVRRALHTGRRAYPFRDWRPLKWGTVYLPGWQPMIESEDTVAENLAAAGYQTGFVCTTQHCWNPSYNFQRGFWQWHFQRGYSGEDRWRSPFGVPQKALTRYGDVEQLYARPHAGGGAPMVLANRGVTMVDETTATANAFRWAGEFLAENREQPFYLLIDSFAPHEPWEAPEKYFLMYGDPDYSGIKHLGSRYGPADRYSQAEVDYLRAQYRGLVTHADHWFGQFMARLEELGLADSTVVCVMSDHGTNFCENPRNVIGKPANSMYPGVMWLPLIVRLPGDVAAGSEKNALVYNHDLPATVYELAGVAPEQPIAGQSLLPLIEERSGWTPRDYVTCRYANSLCYIDDTTWALGNIDGAVEQLFDLEADPGCTTDISSVDDGARWQTAWERILEDADGELPDYRDMDLTDALGRRLK